MIRPVLPVDSLFLSQRAHTVVVDAASRSRNVRFSLDKKANETAGSESKSRRAFFCLSHLGRRLSPPPLSAHHHHRHPLSHHPTKPLSLYTSSWTNKLITAKDHAAVQINVGHLNSEGIFTGATTTLALAGNVRAWGAADTAVDLLWKVRGG